MCLDLLMLFSHTDVSINTQELYCWRLLKGLYLGKGPVPF